MNIKLREGIHILTQEEMIKEQKSWDDGDLSKNKDFTSHDYFLWIDDITLGFDEISEIVQYIELTDFK
jgi:hypothetical protein